jgi:hypothetical protein
MSDLPLEFADPLLDPYAAAAFDEALDPVELIGHRGGHRIGGRGAGTPRQKGLLSTKRFKRSNRWNQRPNQSP